MKDFKTLLIFRWLPKDLSRNCAKLSLNGGFCFEISQLRFRETVLNKRMRRLKKAVNVEQRRPQSTKLSKCLFGKGVLIDFFPFSRFLHLWRARSVIKRETESFQAGFFGALGAVGFVFVALLLSLAAMDFRTLDMTPSAYVEKQGFDFI